MATNRTRLTFTVATLAAAATVVALTACGTAPLSARDPHGYEACTLLIRSRQSTDFAVSFDALLGASREAKQSTSPAIRDAVQEVAGGYGVPVGDDLVRACGDAGVPVPAATSKDPNS